MQVIQERLNQLPITNMAKELLANPTPLFRIGIVIMVLLLSVAAGRLPNAYLPIVALAGPVGLYILVKEPQLGLLGLVGAAMLVEFYIGTGTGSAINSPMMVIGALIGLWVIAILTRQWDIRDIDWTVTQPLVIFLMITVLALLAGQLPWFPLANPASMAAQLGGLSLFFFSGLVFLWVTHQIEDEKWLRYAVWLFIGLASVYIMARLTRQWSITSRFPNRLISGSMFWTWITALAAGQVLFNEKLKRPAQVGLALIVVAGLYASAYLNYDWKSGWMPSVAVLGVLILLRYPQLIVVAFVGGLIAAGDFILDLVNSDSYSYYTRVEAWEILFNIINENPLLGVGPGNYYFYTPLFPIRGYAVSFNSHSQYIDLLAQVGWLGLITYFWFWLSIGWQAWQARNSMPAGFPRAYIFTALGGLAGILVAGALGDWIIPFVYNVGFSGFHASVFAWIFMAGVPLLIRLHGRPQLNAPS